MSIRYLSQPPIRTRPTWWAVPTSRTVSWTVSTRKPTPPKPAFLADSGTASSSAAASTHWCIVAVNRGSPAPPRYSACSTLSLIGGRSAASPGNGSSPGICASASSSSTTAIPQVVVTDGPERPGRPGRPGRPNGAYLIAAPSPPAASPATALAASRPALPKGHPGSPDPSPKALPAGAVNRVSSTSGSTAKLRNSDTSGG